MDARYAECMHTEWLAPRRKEATNDLYELECNQQTTLRFTLYDVTFFKNTI